MESKYDYVVFDIETTGLHPESDQICEIAAIGVKDGLPQGLFSTLVAIEGSIPEDAGRVNGITDDMLKGAPAIGDALDAFLDFIGEDAVLAGHNIASFDIPFVQAAAAKSGRVFIYPYVIDTLEAARELWPDLPSRSMDSLRGILGIERTDAHRALADCYDELAVLNAELSVIMQSYARKMDYCRGELLRIAGEIAYERAKAGAAAIHAHDVAVDGDNKHLHELLAEIDACDARIKELQAARVIALDIIPGAVPMEAYAFPKRCLLLFGAEGPGLSEKALALADDVVYISQFGSVRSINAGAAAAVAMHAWIAQHAVSGV